ncbi:MAG: ribonuclease J, partial [Acidimicrobiales bacterium]
RTDLARLGEIVKSGGVRVLLADSTNAEEHGHAPSERSVGAALKAIFVQQRGRRIITASFASHIHRIQQIIEAAIDDGRVVATLGMSMKKNVRMAREMGLLTIPESRLIDIADVGDLPPEKVCIISTGSQGEPMSALALMAAGENRWIDLGDDDVVIMSSHPIPGNETDVSRVIDGLVRKGAEVVHSGISDVHASGHAKAEDLKMFLSIARPENFVPVHGEYRHLHAHAALAVQMGTAESNVLLAEDGDVLELGDRGLSFHSKVPASYLFVDGIVGDVGHGVLRDRKVLAEEGVVVVIASVDGAAGEVITGPEIITRGWVYAPEADDLLDEAEDTVRAALERALRDGVRDIDSLEREVRRATGKFVNERTKRRPMIVPVVMET